MIKRDEMYKEFVDHLYDGVYFVDKERRISYWNNAAERLTGYLADEIVGKFCYDNFLDHCDSAGKQLCHSGCPLHATICDGKPREADVFLRQKNGIRRPVSVRVAPIYSDEGELEGCVEIFSDNSSKLAVLEELQATRDMAYLDELTKICNRRSMNEFLEAKIEEFKSRKFPFGLAIIDIDNFKSVNDTYGHSVGDQVLKMVAEVLSASSRSFDIVSRWGGEEFMILYSNVESSILQQITERQRMLIAKSKTDAGDEAIQVTITMGATMFTTEDTYETVVKRCDDLLYKGKEQGRNRVMIG